MSGAGQGFPRAGRAAPRDFLRAKPREIPSKTLSIPTLLLGFTFYFKYDTWLIFMNLSNIDVWRSIMVAGAAVSCLHCIGPPQVFHPIFPHLISTVGEFRWTIAIMHENHQNVLLEIEYCIRPQSMHPVYLAVHHYLLHKFEDLNNCPKLSTLFYNILLSHIISFCFILLTKTPFQSTTALPCTALFSSLFSL